MMNIDEMPAGRELDALVAERVMGYVRVTCDDYMQRERGPFADLMPHTNTLVGRSSWRIAPANTPLWEYADIHVPLYSTDIAAVWQVVEWLRAKEMNCEQPDGWVFVDCGPAGWRVEIVFYPDHDAPATLQGVVADTLPLAICRAALKAVQP